MPATDNDGRERQRRVAAVRQTGMDGDVTVVATELSDGVMLELDDDGVADWSVGNGAAVGNEQLWNGRRRRAGWLRRQRAQLGSVVSMGGDDGELKVARVGSGHAKRGRGLRRTAAVAAAASRGG